MMTHKMWSKESRIFYEAVLFKPLKQIRVIHVMFTVASLLTFDLNKSHLALSKDIRLLEGELTDIVTNPSHKIMEQNLSVVISQTSPLGIGLSGNIRV